jgi:hypothetical protein
VRKNYWCIHHGSQTRNDRRLSENIQRDPANPEVIISSGKRDDTGANALSCRSRWYTVPHLIIDDSSTEVTKWVLLQGRGRGGHSHPLAETALLYHVHKKAQPKYLHAVTAALANKGAYLTYRENERVLWGLNLELDRRAYYNLARLKAMSYDGDGLKALIACLEQDGWTYRTLWSVQKDETNSIIAHVLEALFFTLLDLVAPARRFCPDWMSSRCL